MNANVRQLNRMHININNVFQVHFNIILPLILPSDYVPRRLPTKILYVF